MTTINIPNWVIITFEALWLIKVILDYKKEKFQKEVDKWKLEIIETDKASHS